METKKGFYVYSINICNELIREGFNMIGVEPSKKKDGKYVFIFQRGQRDRKLRRRYRRLCTARDTRYNKKQAF